MLPLQTEVKYRPRAKNVGRVPTDLFVSFPMFQCFFEKMHSRTPTNEQEHCDFFLKICTRKRRQIRPDGTQMSKKSWFGGVLGPYGGSWSPAGPKTRPDTFLDAKTTFVAHPWGMLFGTILVFFCVFFCCLGGGDTHRI